MRYIFLALPLVFSLLPLFSKNASRHKKRPTSRKMTNSSMSEMFSFFRKCFGSLLNKIHCFRYFWRANFTVIAQLLNPMFTNKKANSFLSFSLTFENERVSERIQFHLGFCKSGFSILFAASDTNINPSASSRKWKTLKLKFKQQRRKRRFYW